jgi:hypothetical protein
MAWAEGVARTDGLAATEDGEAGEGEGVVVSTWVFILALAATCASVYTP